MESVRVQLWESQLTYNLEVIYGIPLGCQVYVRRKNWMVLQ